MVLTVTLATGAACVLFYLLLSVRVVAGRSHSRYAISATPNAELLVRIRTHANFAEYVPLALLMLGLLELGGIAALWLWALGGTLLVSRALHAYGLPRTSPNPWRLMGVLGTFGVLLAEALLAGHLLWLHASAA